MLIYLYLAPRIRIYCAHNALDIQSVYRLGREKKKVKTVLKCQLCVDVDVVRTVEASHTLLLVIANEKSGHLTEQY